MPRHAWTSGGETSRIGRLFRAAHAQVNICGGRVVGAGDRTELRCAVMGCTQRLGRGAFRFFESVSFLEGVTHAEVVSQRRVSRTAVTRRAGATQLPKSTVLKKLGPVGPSRQGGMGAAQLTRRMGVHSKVIPARGLCNCNGLRKTGRPPAVTTRPQVDT